MPPSCGWPVFQTQRVPWRLSSWHLASSAIADGLQLRVGEHLNAQRLGAAWAGFVSMHFLHHHPSRLVLRHLG